MQLKGGHFTAAGVTGAFNFGLDFGLQGSAKLTLAGTGLHKAFTVGSFTKPVYTWGVKSTAKFGSFGLVSSRVPIPKDVATLSLGAPRVTSKGSNPNTGSTAISGTGISTPMVKLNADLVQLAENFGLGVPIEKFTAAIKGDKTDGFISVTTLVAILSLSLDLIQKFDLTDSGGLTPVLLVDGHPEPLQLDGTPLTIHNASSLGPTPFNISLGLVPTNPTVTNKTALGANGKVSMTALSFSFGALGITLGPFGPAYKNTNLKLFGTSPPLYTNTFACKGSDSRPLRRKCKAGTSFKVDTVSDEQSGPVSVAPAADTGFDCAVPDCPASGGAGEPHDPGPPSPGGGHGREQGRSDPHCTAPRVARAAGKDALGSARENAVAGDHPQHGRAVQHHQPCH